MRFLDVQQSVSLGGATHGHKDDPMHLQRRQHAGVREGVSDVAKPFGSYPEQEVDVETVGIVLGIRWLCMIDLLCSVGLIWLFDQTCAQTILASLRNGFEIDPYTCLKQDGCGGGGAMGGTLSIQN